MFKHWKLLLIISALSFGGYQQYTNHKMKKDLTDMVSVKNFYHESHLECLLQNQRTDEILTFCEDYLSLLQDENSELKRILNKVNYVEISDVTITAYNPLRNQTDSTPRIAASGNEVYEGSCAVSRDLLKKFDPTAKVDWGDTVWVFMPFVVEDTMNKRYTQRVDIFMENYRMAKNFGVKTGYLLY